MQVIVSGGGQNRRPRSRLQLVVRHDNCATTRRASRIGPGDDEVLSCCGHARRPGRVSGLIARTGEVDQACNRVG
jgi:hypothetical protein